MKSNTEIVPFGKYKDQPIELMLADQDYLHWVSTQPGIMAMLQSKHPAVFNIITVGAPATSDTPEHNKLQAMFLDRTFQYAFIELATGKSVHAVASEVAAAVNNSAQRWFQYALDVSAKDFRESTVRLQKAREENAKSATEDGRKHYEEERKAHIAEEKERDKRELAGYSRIFAAREFPKYEDWLKTCSYGTWPRTVKDRREELESATVRVEADEKAWLDIASTEPDPVAPEHPKVQTDFECGYDVDFSVYWSSGIKVQKEQGYRGGKYEYSSYEPRVWKKNWDSDGHDWKCQIELKPQLGDDFPAVLRQMKRNRADTLVVGFFEATSCTLEQVRAMFGERRIITLQEINAICQRGVWPEKTDK
jgi:hypothetical protein